MSGSGPLYLCAKCGSSVPEDDARCARCGSELASLEDAPADREENVWAMLDTLDWPLCPACGADNDPRRETCRACGSPLESTSHSLVVPEPWAEPPGLPQRAPLEGTVDILGETPAQAVRHDPGDRSLRRSTRRPRSSRRFFPWPLDEEVLASVVAAAAVGIYASAFLGLTWALWGLGALLAAFLVLGLLAAYPDGFRPVRPLDGALLTVGAATPALGLSMFVSATAASSAAAIGFALAPAFPLCVATLRVTGTAARILLAPAGAASMIPYAIVAAGTPVIGGTPGWTLGLLVTAVFPTLLVWEIFRTRRDSETVDRLLARAEGRFVRRRYAASLRAYDQAIERSEKDEVRGDLPWYGKGAALTILGRYGEALRAIERALDLNPRNEVAWVNKGNALTRMGRFVDALRAFNAAIKVNPTYEVAWNNKGNALARIGRLEEALRSYDRALQIDSTYRSAWVNKGQVLATLRRYDEARACASAVSKLTTKGRGSAE